MIQDPSTATPDIKAHDELLPSAGYNLILQLFDESFRALHAPLATASVCERLATIIFDAMTTRNRSYHGIQHICEMTKHKDPAAILAGLFHDVVYWQVDRARNPVLQALMEPGPPNDLGTLKIGIPKNERSAGLLNAVFGVHSGQELTPSSGMNEYLSASIAEKLLRDLIGKWDLVRVLACIEGTIPFRSSKDGRAAPIDALHVRLLSLVGSAPTSFSECGVPVGASEITNLLSLVVDVANQDVAGFATSEPRDFLTESVRVMLEGNPPLQLANARISDWRKAFQRAYGFYSTLSPIQIFQTRPAPIDNRTPSIEELRSRAAGNLRSLATYLQVQLAVTTLTEAIAVATGGDAPADLFLPEVYPRASTFGTHEIGRHASWVNTPFWNGFLTKEQQVHIEREALDAIVLRWLRYGDAVPSEACGPGVQAPPCTIASQPLGLDLYWSPDLIRGQGSETSEWINKYTTNIITAYQLLDKCRGAALTLLRIFQETVPSRKLRLKKLSEFLRTTPDDTFSLQCEKVIPQDE